MSSTSTSTMNYEANGNLVTKSQGKDFWRFGWDHENRLTTGATRKQTIRYRYDALGRRIQRYFIRGEGPNTKFIYDGLDVVMDDNSGVLTKYQNGPGIDNKLKMSANGVSKYFVADHLGSTNALTDASGAILEQTAYDSFGNVSNQLSTRYAFTGREFDNFTGLHYYRARWYDSNLGRFISEDPVDFKGGDVNLYGYTWNVPIRFVDPLGLDVRAYFFRKGGRDGGARLEIYDNDKPPQEIWKENTSNDVNDPVGDYQWEYSGEVIDEGLFSGDKECKNDVSCEVTPFKGPIPAGDYAISEYPDRRSWYWLYRRQPNGTFSDFAPIRNGVSRGNFRWHLGRVSWGCLTFSWELRETYKRLDGLLKGTSRSPFLLDDDGKTYQRSGRGVITVF
ncbi:MAG: DUF2778 domain-containing protein [Acidobacteria bacterium]|nr:DUF2778 domain-containing protein [Acidobacteriota bacterium]